LFDLFDCSPMPRKHWTLCGGGEMGNASEYQKRAEQCAERALRVTRADDRARWRELAEEWTALSRLQFLKLREQRDEASALWRGDESQRVEAKAKLANLAASRRA
jgi:hypothetical protein